MKKLLEQHETLMQIVNNIGWVSPIYKPKFSSKKQKIHNKQDQKCFLISRSWQSFTFCL